MLVPAGGQESIGKPKHSRVRVESKAIHFACLPSQMCRVSECAKYFEEIQRLPFSTCKVICHAWNWLWWIFFASIFKRQLQTGMASDTNGHGRCGQRMWWQTKARESSVCVNTFRLSEIELVKICRLNSGLIWGHSQGDISSSENLRIIPEHRRS